MGTGSNEQQEEAFMYTGQIMMIAGGVMIALSVTMTLVLAAVFGKNEKKLIREIYGEMEEREL